MRKLKKLASLLLTAALTLSLAVTTFAAVEDTGFSDVNAGVWYSNAVAYVTENNLMDPIGTNRFSPDTDATRSALAVALYRAVGSPQVGAHSFNDISAGSSYASAAAWAQANGVIAGYDNGGFGGEDSITREQIVTILWRYAGSPAPGVSQDFTDESAISSYASQAVDWSRENGVVNGYTDGRFGPQDHTTRAQLAVILQGYLTRNQPVTPEQPNPEQPSSETKILVAYFSATNTTKPLAEYIADGLNADLYEIVPETPYTSVDLNYGNSSSRTSIEMNDPNSRPAISGRVSNMEQYDVVFIGYPIWWGEAPRIVSTFFESYNFSSKTIVPFCTSGSSGIGSSARNLSNLTDGANWLEGRRFGGGTSQNTIIDWVNGLGLSVTAQ